MKLGVIANCTKQSATRVLNSLAELAPDYELELVTFGETASFLPSATHVSEEAFPSSIEVLMAMGGDGTMLASVATLKGADVPLIGVNLGKLGFLTSLREEQLEDALKALSSAEYNLSKRTTVNAKLIRDGKEIINCDALNEVVTGFGASSRVADLSLSVEGRYVTTFICDGLIVSTPTGSTGHNLSAGGPVMHPDTEGLIITLICPHALSARPVVVPKNKTLSVLLNEQSKALVLAADGNVVSDLLPGDKVEISAGQTPVSFIQLKDAHYFDLLREKLAWKGSNIH